MKRAIIIVSLLATIGTASAQRVSLRISAIGWKSLFSSKAMVGPQLAIAVRRPHNSHELMFSYTGVNTGDSTSFFSPPLWNKCYGFELGYRYLYRFRDDKDLQPYVGAGFALNYNYLSDDVTLSFRFPLTAHVLKFQLDVIPGLQWHFSDKFYLDVSTPLTIRPFYYLHQRIENPILPESAKANSKFVGGAGQTNASVEKMSIADRIAIIFGIAIKI